MVNIFKIKRNKTCSILQFEYDLAIIITVNSSFMYIAVRHAILV